MGNCVLRKYWSNSKGEWKHTMSHVDNQQPLLGVWVKACLRRVLKSSHDWTLAPRRA